MAPEGPNGRRNLGTHPQGGLAAETSGSELSQSGVQLCTLAGQTLYLGVDQIIILRQHAIHRHVHQADLDQKIVVKGEWPTPDDRLKVAERITADLARVAGAA